MIFIFDDERTPQNPDGNRLSIAWHGVEYNKPDTQAVSGIEELPFGIFTETVGHNTPVNFQSEMHPDILKNGGGVEYYNPRIGSRVLSIRALVRVKSLFRLGAILQEIQDDFSPLELQWDHASAWPPPNGRPEWTDPWHSNFRPLTFTRLNDGTEEAAFKTSFADGQVPLQYAVAPLQLPDPVISATQSGYGAKLDLSWLLLDGGRAIARSKSTSTGTTQSDIVQLFGQVPAFPEVSFPMEGAGHASFTLTVTGDSGHYAPTALVLDLSGRSNLEAIRINMRDRKAYVDDVLTQGIIKSGEYPVVPPQGAGSNTLTYTFTNTTNVGTITTSWFETMSS